MCFDISANFRSLIVGKRSGMITLYTFKFFNQQKDDEKAWKKISWETYELNYHT